MTERIFYSNQQVGIRPDSEGDDSFAAGDQLFGVQSVGMTTTFNLSQVFELGQLALYENSEDLPDVEATVTKVLDGKPLTYIMATQDATTSPSLAGRSNAKCFFGLSIFDDTTDAAAGTALSTVQCSGMFISSVTYNFPLDDPFTEEVTLVGNNKIWANAPTYGSTLHASMAGTTIDFAGQFSTTVDDSPVGGTAGGVNRRENLVYGTDADLVYDRTQLPLEVLGVDGSGFVILSASNRPRVSSISASVDLGRDNLLELGRRAPYHRFVTFPTEVTCDIEVTSTSGDFVSAIEQGIFNTSANPCNESTNLQNRTIRVATCDGTRVFLGNKNKLSSVSYGGGDAAGGNVTVTYSYSNFNDFTVLHPSGISDSGLAWWTDRGTFLA